MFSKNLEALPGLSANKNPVVIITTIVVVVTLILIVVLGVTRLYLHLRTKKRLIREQQLNNCNALQSKRESLYHKSNEVRVSPKRYTLSPINSSIEANYNNILKGGISTIVEVDESENFMNGNLNIINPDMTLDEQSNMLPYDQKYEFPRAKLEIGKQVGNGAFGIVFEAIAHGIVPGEDRTTVAVKTIRKMADNEVGTN